MKRMTIVAGLLALCAIASAQLTNIGFYVHHLRVNQAGIQEAALCYAALFGNDMDAFYFVSADPAETVMNGPHYSMALERARQDGVDHIQLYRIKNSTGVRTQVAWILFQSGYSGAGQIIYQTIDNPLPQYRLAQCQVASNSTGIMYGVIP